MSSEVAPSFREASEFVKNAFDYLFIGGENSELVNYSHVLLTRLQEANHII